MPEAVRLLDVDRVAGEHELLGLAGPELPRVREVLDAAHAEPGADDVGEACVLGRDDEVARPHEHQPGGVHRAVHLGDGDLAEVAPPQRVLEEVVPLLQHQVLGALAGAAVDRARRVLVRARARTPPTTTFEPMSWPDENIGPVAAEDHHAHGVVGLGPQERVVELDEQPAVLRVPRLGPVQHDPRDRAVVERLVGDVLVASATGSPFREWIAGLSFGSALTTWPMRVLRFRWVPACGARRSSVPSYETFIYEEADGVAIVTLNRPEVLQRVQRRRCSDELRHVWRRCARNDDVRAVVLTGAGEKAFCTGIDRDETIEGYPATSRRPRDTDTARHVSTPFMFNDPGDYINPKQNDLWKPVVAAVNGMACGGALYMLGEVGHHHRRRARDVLRSRT